MKKELTELERLAVELAICAPRRQNGAHTLSATVPWEIIHETRAAMAKVGLDWRALRAKMEGIKKERRAAAEGGTS